MDCGYSLSPDLLSFSMLGVTMNLEHPISEVVTSKKKKKNLLIVTQIFTVTLLQIYIGLQLTFSLIWEKSLVSICNIWCWHHYEPLKIVQPRQLRCII